MILNSFRRKKKKKRIYTYTGISSVRLHSPPAFSHSLFVFNNRYNEYWEKKRDRKGGKEKNLAPLLESHAILSSGI